MNCINPIKLLSVIGVLSQVPLGTAVELNIQVFELDSKPLSEAVVYAVPADPQSIPATPLKMAVMDQRNRAFVPHVLAIPVGTKVDFPNTDTVNHYVYSFSEIKKFQFKLFKGDSEKHQTLFDKAGLAIMGCNIHDFMLGYIFVAPTPFVGVTDGVGQLHLELPDKGTFTLELWHERSNENLDKLTQTLVLEGVDQNVQIRFTKRLKPIRKMFMDNEYY